MQRPREPDSGRDVRFFERAGDDARATLERLGDRLQAEGAEVELLASADQPGLWLLVARGGPEVEAAEGTRRWRFRTVKG